MKPTIPYTIRIATELLPNPQRKDLRKRLKKILENYLKKQL